MSGFGFSLRSDWGTSPTVSLFEFAFHHHPKRDSDPCQFRFGFMFAFLGFHIDIGVFIEPAWQ